MNNDPLANVLSTLVNAEKIGKRECIVWPASKIIIKILDIMKDHKYIGTYEVNDNGRGGEIKVTLSGKMNNCRVIKPRLPVTKKGFEKFEKRYLPAKDFGIIIVSTSKGIMIHNEAKEKGLGGTLIAYVY